MLIHLVLVLLVVAGTGCDRTARPILGATYFPLVDAANHSEKDIRKCIGRMIEFTEVVQAQVPWRPGNRSGLQAARELASLAREHGRELSISIDWLDASRQHVRRGTGESWSFSNADVRREFEEVTNDLAALRPLYLNLAVEVNFFALIDPDGFREFVGLFRRLARRIVKEYPMTAVTVSFQYELLRDIHAFSGKPHKISPHPELITYFGPELGVIGISTYPSQIFNDPNEIPPGYLDSLTTDGRRLAIFETSWPTEADDLAQDRYAEWIFDSATRLGIEFIAWTSICDSLVGSEGEHRPGIESWFGRLGIWEYDGSPKRMSDRWQTFLSDSERREWPRRYLHQDVRD